MKVCEISSFVQKNKLSEVTFIFFKFPFPLFLFNLLQIFCLQDAYYVIFLRSHRLLIFTMDSGKINLLQDPLKQKIAFLAWTF